jgi:NADH:ubiquinone reductase (H+-translocating)
MSADARPTNAVPNRVVIVGGGFGGLYAAKALGGTPAQVTLLDRRNYHLFQPLLYQAATGSLSPGEIAWPLRSILKRDKNIKTLMAEVTDFDVDAREVILSDGSRVPYDTLIVAAGAGNSYFGHTDWGRVAPGLKSIEDATAMRQHILSAFEAAEREPDAQKRNAWLTFLVVGAGPTGVELAGALGEIANDALRDDFRSFRPNEARILVLDGAPRVLQSYPADLAEAAEKSLIRLGVRVRANVRVTSITADGVTIQGERGDEFIPSKTVLWAAGVAASPLGKALGSRSGAAVDRGGRVIVEPDLTLPGHPEIFVIGDLAAVKDKAGQPIPGVAPAAMQQGRYAAAALVKRLRGERASAPFEYFDKGSLAVIGRNAAVAQFGKVHLHGRLAWLLWLFIHLMYLVQFRTRLLVFIQWGFQYLTFSRGARLITFPEKGDR